MEQHYPGKNGFHLAHGVLSKDAEISSQRKYNSHYFKTANIKILSNHYKHRS